MYHIDIPNKNTISHYISHQSPRCTKNLLGWNYEIQLRGQLEDSQNAKRLAGFPAKAKPVWRMLRNPNVFVWSYAQSTVNHTFSFNSIWHSGVTPQNFRNTQVLCPCWKYNQTWHWFHDSFPKLQTSISQYSSIFSHDWFPDIPSKNPMIVGQLNQLNVSLIATRPNSIYISYYQGSVNVKYWGYNL